MTGAHLAAAVFGSFAGTLLFTSSIRWVWLAAEAWSQAARVAGGKPPFPRLALTIAAQSLFHSGPWLAVAAAFFAWHVRSEPWVPWFFAGALASLAFMGAVTANALVQMRRGRARRGPDAGAADPGR
jgi:hypothetical protein